MDSKREYGSAAAQHSKRRHEEDSQQPNNCIVIGKYLRCRLDIEKDVAPRVAALVQKLVREELERQVLLLRPSINESGAAGVPVKMFELVFKNDFPATVFTHSHIKAKDGSHIQIALRNTRSRLTVTEGPLSSIKVKICVLNGEFGGDDNEYCWTTMEFKANISRERENRSKLLKGDTVITLNNGVRYIDKIMFTDNSKCTWSRHFRLGAIVVSTSDEANIKEAISNPFIVKDTRGDSNQKHYPPALNDEVYRLENISKNGKIHERLREIGINTVKDLLQLYETNPSLLRQKFGKSSSRKVERTIKYANTCAVEVITQGQNEMPWECNGAPYLQVLHYLPTAHQELSYGGGQVEENQEFGQPSTSTSLVGEAACNNNQLGFPDLLSSGICIEAYHHHLSILGPTHGE
ncbi:hypothetical protein PIB30_041724 [Stylosanthes scabra]|uniref:Uncharacterized protein n=1 Tax=Stylosanthes scabra TaxID=79078 RepID=A0ABU6XDG3_9FABA|nr:hypothetical protein [Stylosanthes scabra]